MALFWSFLVACCDSDVWASSSLGARDQGPSEYCWVVVSTGSVRDPGILGLFLRCQGRLVMVSASAVSAVWAGERYFVFRALYFVCICIVCICIL
jgi:hypothetical protein